MAFYDSYLFKQITAFCIIFPLFRWFFTSYTEYPVVAIGILSARENFDLRKAARSTWLKEYSPSRNDDVKAWFIIAQQCSIAPQYRQDKYGCRKWNIEPNAVSEIFSTSNEILPRTCLPKNKNILYQGFSFKVQHPVVIKRLGVLFDLLIPQEKIKVAILDIQTKKAIVETEIVKNSSCVAENGYLYQDVDTVLFPAEFEGMVLVEGYLQSETCSEVSWNNGGGVITFNQLYTSDFHLESMKYTSKSVSAASIEFFVHDLEGLLFKAMNERNITSDWIKRVEEINQKLLLESRDHNDIVFVDSIDSYRNLPHKLLNFYSWLCKNYKFSYVIKADDDSIVDIPNLLFEMDKRGAELKVNEFWLWSRFRRDWPVNYVGKWADLDYRSSLYPAFPCGATYVMSNEVVHWLNQNTRVLFPYQGEDVSMGIWLSAINPNFIDDDNFECDAKCTVNSYNRAQLSSKEIYETWALYNKCKNLCTCT